MICHEKHNEIIQLSCKQHYCCLESLLNFYIVNNKIVKKCFFCQKQYDWKNCKSLISNQPSPGGEGD